MNNLIDYYISFKPRSPLITPLHSDTIFGHVAWAVRYLWKESDLITFLDAFKADADAPFLISDGFPAGKLPRPFFKAMPLAQIKMIINEVAKEFNKKLDVLQETQILKSLKKQVFITLETFQKIQANCSAETLLRESARELDWEMLLSRQGKKKKMKLKNVVIHNTINRIYGTVTEGLYQQTEDFYPEDFSFDVYVKTSYFSFDQLKQIFALIENMGFGRDKSTGKGKFSIEVKQTSPLPRVSAANAFMVLSHYVPNPGAPTAGFYRIMTKYGRLGGNFACSVIPGIEAYYGGEPPKVHPYKKPIVMIKPGSVFLSKPQFNYGMLLGGEQKPIHKFPAIRHYAYAYPVGLNVKEEEFA